MIRTTDTPPAVTRFHTGLEVGDLEQATRFYRVLFGTEPTKVRQGYAKFELEDPPVVLSLIEGKRRVAFRRSSDHFGIRVATPEAVDRAATRLEAGGLSLQREESTTCCYAVQTKVWAKDPDGREWEVYTVLADDASRREDDASACCAETCCTGTAET